MFKKYIPSIITAIVTFTILSSPILTFLCFYIALGFLSLWLEKKFEYIAELPTGVHFLAPWVIIPIQAIVNLSDITHYLRIKYKFQSPIIKK